RDLAWVGFLVDRGSARGRGSHRRNGPHPPSAPSPVKGAMPRKRGKEKLKSALAAHVLQERVVALEHDHAFAVGERGAVGLEAALEGVEARIAARGLAVDAGGFGIAFTAQLLRVALGLRD